jgi:hypothetical protein
MFLLIGFGQYFLISVPSLGHFLGFISSPFKKANRDAPPESREAADSP